MSHVEYLLNSTAWTLLGVLLTLTYQRVLVWNRKRKNAPAPIQMTSQAWLAAFIICLSIASFFFSLSSNLAFRTKFDCVNKINQHNVAVENERSKRNSEDKAASIEVFNEIHYIIHHPTDPANNKNFNASIDNVYTTTAKNDKYREMHPIVSSASCNKSKR